MTNVRITVLSLVLLGVLACATPQGTRLNTVSIDPLPREYFGRCDFAFYSTPPDAQKPLDKVFCLDINTGKGVISINGSPSFLTLQNSKEHVRHADHETIGDRYVEVWQGADATVTLRYRITFVCPPDDETCEVTRYEGTMQVTVGADKRLYKVWGDLGV